MKKTLKPEIDVKNRRIESFFLNRRPDNESGGFGCHYLHLHKGVCQSDEYLDGCRMYKPLASGSECWKEENETGSGPEVWTGELFRLDSRCFFSNMIIEVGADAYRPVHIYLGMFYPANRSWVFGYRGEVFCPDKRLCYYPDIIPSMFLQKPRPSILLSTAAPFSVQPRTERPVTGLRFNSDAPVSVRSVTTVVGVTAVFVFLGSLMLIYRKCCRPRFRVHTLIRSPYTLHV
ncbi:hypothetical protein Baya_9356 [Bagarius yarrelli]|uniref:Uncharacterized protein n=1 Tax=Bagarius yarrelli TaxID=175774 RepID=A0A556U673_BAGYA|nr:hypothetical protein Baya_9356 [Bagarius yarrelli]